MILHAMPLESGTHCLVVDAGEVEAPAEGLLPFGTLRQAAARGAGAFHRLQAGAALPARAQGDPLAVQI